jgi:hypothetical protein
MTSMCKLNAFHAPIFAPYPIVHLQYISVFFSLLSTMMKVAQTVAMFLERLAGPPFLLRIHISIVVQQMQGDDM